MKSYIYAVKNGRKTGIFDEWVKCYEQTDKYPNSKFHRFTYRIELEDEAEDVPGSLRHAIKEAEEYLKDLTYQGECADYLEDPSWKEHGFLPFGNEPEVYKPEDVSREENDGYPFPGMSEAEAYAEDVVPFGNASEEKEQETDDVLPFAGTFEAKEPETDDVLPFAGKFEAEESEKREQEEAIEEQEHDRYYGSYRESRYWIVKELRAYVHAIHCAKNDSEKEVAARRLNWRLKRCLLLEDLSELTAIYKDKEEDNAIGYNPTAVRNFVSRMAAAFPKPESSETGKPEDEPSMQQLLMQAEAVENELKEMVLGRDVAIEKLRAAYFDRELTIRLQPDKGGPRGVYLLAGPPGVGKTYMAQLFARKLGLPFKRFDMSGYSNNESIQELAGFAATWRSSEAGILTEFVFKIRNAFFCLMK